MQGDKTSPWQFALVLFEISVDPQYVDTQDTEQI